MMRPCEAAARSIRIGEPRPIMPRTSTSANALQSYSTIIRLSAKAISATVSSSVPSRSNSTAARRCPRQCASSRLCIERDTDRAMIAPQDGGMDLGLLHRVAQLPRHEHVIDSPPDVARPRIGEMTPPRVVPVALREQAKGVDETRIHEVLESLTFFIREALLAAIRFGIGQIELGVRDIEVAAKNDRLGLLQLLAIGEEGRIPVFESQRQAAEVVLGIGRVDRHDIKFLEFRRHDPAFLGAIALQFVGKREALRKLERKAVDDGQRLLLRENRSARIALLHRGIPVLAVVRQIDLELSALGLGLLQTDDIGPELVEKRLKYPFLDDGANAVDVPGKNLHAISHLLMV